MRIVNRCFPRTHLVFRFEQKPMRVPFSEDHTVMSTTNKMLASKVKQRSHNL